MPRVRKQQKEKGIPDLDKYLTRPKRNWVTYKEGARIYGIPFYSFVRLAREAKANITLRKTAIADVDLIEAYLDENPEVAFRVHSVRRY